MNIVFIVLCIALVILNGVIGGIDFSMDDYVSGYEHTASAV